jgi:hypothetical protein
VAVECDILVIPTKVAPAVLPQLENDATTEMAWEALQPSLAAGEVARVAHLMVKGASEEVLNIAASKEVRYPSGYGRDDPGFDPHKDPTAEELKKWPPAVFTPGELWTRGVGPSLKVEVKVAEGGGWISADCELDHVRELGTLKFDLGQTAAGQKVSGEQPIFHSVLTRSTFRLRNGSRVLVSTQTLPENGGYEVMLFKATARKLEEKP